MAAGEDREWWERQWREVEEVSESNEGQGEELEVEGVRNAGERITVGAGPCEGIDPCGAVSQHSCAEKKVDDPARTDGSNDEKIHKVEKLRISEDASDKSSDINSIESNLVDAFIEMGFLDNPRFSEEDTMRVISEEKKLEPIKPEVSKSESPGKLKSVNADQVPDIRLTEDKDD